MTRPYTAALPLNGLERTVMRRYEIDDLRLFFENNLKFLKILEVEIMKLPLSWIQDYVDIEGITSKVSRHAMSDTMVEHFTARENIQMLLQAKY